MRPSLLAALALLLLLSRPAQAQPPEQVLLDITAQVRPGGKTEGHCLVLDRAGTLDMSVTMVGRAPDRPVAFTIYRVRGSDDDLAIFDQPITRTAFEQQAPVEPDLYCYSLANNQPEPPDATNAELSGLTQDVAIRLVLTP